MEIVSDGTFQRPPAPYGWGTGVDGLVNNESIIFFAYCQIHFKLSKLVDRSPYLLGNPFHSRGAGR